MTLWSKLMIPGARTAAAATVFAGLTAFAAEPAGLPPVAHPKDNPPSEEKILLGKQLYFDPRLSSDGTISCASCHDPKKGWSNGEAVATGVGGQKGGRSAPTVINSAYFKFQFWDGRAGSLEEQALGPIQNPIEMNLTLEQVVEKLNGIPGYKEQFQKVFGTDVTSEGIAKAIAAFERTVLSGDAPYDKFKAGDKSALSEAAQRGMKLFFGKANCSACHSGHSFTDFAFHNIGYDSEDVGRVAISKLKGDTGAMKTPTLRDIAKSGPYMHNGGLATLEDVVAHYNKGGNGNPQQDEEIYPLGLHRRRNGRPGDVPERRPGEFTLPRRRSPGVAEIGRRVTLALSGWPAKRKHSFDESIAPNRCQRFRFRDRHTEFDAGWRDRLLPKCKLCRLRLIVAEFDGDPVAPFVLPHRLCQELAEFELNVSPPNITQVNIRKGGIQRPFDHAHAPSPKRLGLPPVGPAKPWSAYQRTVPEVGNHHKFRSFPARR